MSLDTLLEAAKYLEYRTLATSRGEIPKDYPTFASCLSPGDDSGPAQHQPSSSDASTGENSFSYNDDVKERRRGGGSGTREVHNKLEKNRRAHLKKCFETLRRQVNNGDDKKTSNLNILQSALLCIKDLHKEEHNLGRCLQRLGRERNLLDQRLLTLKEQFALVNEGVLFRNVELPAVTDDNDSNSTSTASECGPPSDTEDAKPFAYTQASLPLPTAIKVESHSASNNGKGPSVVTALRHAVTATSSTAAASAVTTTTPSTVGHHTYGRTLAPHPPVLAPGSVVHGAARSGAPATLTFGTLPPRLQLTSVGFPTAQGFHHAGLNGASPTVLTHPTVQVLTTQQSPVRLIATPVGAATGQGVTLTMGAAGATSRLAYAAASGTVLTAAQQQLPVTATLASMQGGGATRLGTGSSVAGAVQPSATIAFAQLVKPEAGAFSALATASLSFKNSVVSPPTGAASPSVTLSTANGTTNHLHHAANNTFARQLVAAAAGQQPQQQVVVPVAGFLHQLQFSSAGKPLVVVTAAPSLPGGMAPPQTIVAQSLPVSR